MEMNDKLDHRGEGQMVYTSGPQGSQDSCASASAFDDQLK
jgi:hypothetical protein